MHAQKNEPHATWSGLMYYMHKHSEGTEYSIIGGGGVPGNGWATPGMGVPPFSELNMVN